MSCQNLESAIARLQTGAAGRYDEGVQSFIDQPRRFAPGFSFLNLYLTPTLPG
jgi:hypothetical protein